MSPRHTGIYIYIYYIQTSDRQKYKTQVELLPFASNSLMFSNQSRSTKLL